MSWSKPALIFALALTAMGMGACGYTPLYGDTAAGVSNSEALTHVEIAPIDAGLVGYDVYTGLLDHLNPESKNIAMSHRLEIRLSPTQGGVLVQPDAATTRYNYTLLCTYRLFDLATGKVVSQGSVTGTSSYNVVTAEYATVAARRDAERRAARTVSDAVALRVALYMKTKAS